MTWLASAWDMLEDMVLQRARVIAVFEAAGHANRGDHLPVYSGRSAELRSGIAAALRAAASGRTSWITGSTSRRRH